MVLLVLVCLAVPPASLEAALAGLALLEGCESVVKCNSSSAFHIIQYKQTAHVLRAMDIPARSAASTVYSHMSSAYPH
eukprot:18164-Heterococcus_DN1.PRE.3